MRQTPPANDDLEPRNAVVTRAEALARYRPIRASIRHVLREAMAAYSRADVTRAVKQIAPWADDEDLEDDRTAEMLADIALFEPNQRGRRVYDRFLAEKTGRFKAADRAVAEQMVTAWFSLFRVVGRHEVAGMWLEDLLAGNRRLWYVDEAFETSAREDLVVGMRLFDAGPFHTGFGIIVQPDEETIEVCLNARARGNRLPFRHSLAATLYGDELQEKAPLGVADMATLATLLKIYVAKSEAPGRAKARTARQKQPRPRQPPQRRKG